MLMKIAKIALIVLSALGLYFIGACNEARVLVN